MCDVTETPFPAWKWKPGEWKTQDTCTSVLIKRPLNHHHSCTKHLTKNPVMADDSLSPMQLCRVTLLALGGCAPSGETKPGPRRHALMPSFPLSPISPFPIPHPRIITTHSARKSTCLLQRSRFFTETPLTWGFLQFCMPSGRPSAAPSTCGAPHAAVFPASPARPDAGLISGPTDMCSPHGGPRGWAQKICGERCCEAAHSPMNSLRIGHQQCGSLDWPQQLVE